MGKSSFRLMMNVNRNIIQKAGAQQYLPGAAHSQRIALLVMARACMLLKMPRAVLVNVLVSFVCSGR